VFEAAVPEWSPLFAGGWVANTKQQYFTCERDGALSEVESALFKGRGGSSKEAMIATLCEPPPQPPRGHRPPRPPTRTSDAAGCLQPDPADAYQDCGAERELLLLVDDSISQGGKVERMQHRLGLELLDLPYEREGLDDASMQLIEAMVAEGGEEAAAAVPAAQAAPAAPVKSEAALKTEVQTLGEELQAMKLGALSKRAKQAGVAVERLEEAQDEEEPKAAVIALILAKEAAGETEEVRAAGPT